MNIGDKLYCWNNDHIICHDFIIGKFYIITFINDDITSDNKLYIKGELNEDWFYVKQRYNHKYYYGNFFYTLQELRKVKLEKLNEGR